MQLVISCYCATYNRFCPRGAYSNEEGGIIEIYIIINTNIHNYMVISAMKWIMKSKNFWVEVYDQIER